jgi:hypothetical protein
MDGILLRVTGLVAGYAAPVAGPLASSYAGARSSDLPAPTAPASPHC